MTRSAERAGVNLAAPVSDGQQVLVLGAGAGAVGAAGGSGATAGPVSLNAAHSRAARHAARHRAGDGPEDRRVPQQHGAFHSVDGLDAIPGIGPARLAELQGLVVP